MEYDHIKYYLKETKKMVTKQKVYIFEIISLMRYIYM